MGLRCSLLGHAYGASEVEREREERGNEVVVVVREVETCERCGRTTVVSENKEVRSIEPNPAAGETSATDDPRDSDDDGEHVAYEEPDDLPDEDDGVIIDDEVEPEDEAERAYGEWPTHDDASVEEADADATAADADAADVDTESSAWPSVEEANDEGFDARPTSDDDVGEVTFGGGLTPEASDDAADVDATEDEGVEFIEAVEAPAQVSAAVDEPEPEPVRRSADLRSGIKSAGPAKIPGANPDAETENTEFYCPECGFTKPGPGSSLRSGDICPDCHRGYLTERPR